ncbi:MAG: DUF4258 domain-containing protein [Cytophagales bacterium]
MDCKSIIFSGHAIQKMFERNILVENIFELIQLAEIVKEYDDDKPFPSKLLLSFVETQPLHIVVAYNIVAQQCVVITVYRPDISIWNADFKTRR